MSGNVKHSALSPLVSVTLQCLRSLVRTRFVPAMVVMLVIAGTVLPWTLHGDGTADGEIKVLLTWSLGIVFTLLAVATLWSGSSMISGEIHEGQFSVVRTTPAGKFKIWFGKWAGLAIIDGILLAGVMMLISAQIAIRGIPFSEMRPQFSISPSEETFTDFAKEFYPAAVSAKMVPENVPYDLYCKEIIKKVKSDYFNIEPGKSFKWKFDYDGRRLRGGETPEAVVRFIAPSGSLGGISGSCIVTDAEGNQLSEYRITDRNKTEIRIQIPPSAFRESGTFSLEVRNFDNASGDTLLIHLINDVRLNIPSGSFAFNMFCAWLALWSVLAAVAALGITISSAFTSPVAVFVASAIAVMGVISHADMTAESGCSHGEEPGAIIRILEKPSQIAFTGLSAITKPYTETEALSSIGDKIQVHPDKAVRSFIFVGIIIPLIAGFFSALILKFREFQ